MALAILPAVFLLLWLQVWYRRGSLGWSGLSRRGAFLLAFLLFETVLVGITELSSVGRHFTSGVVLVCWLVVALVLLALSWRPLWAGARRAGAALGRLHPRHGVSTLLAGERAEAAGWLLVPAFFFGVLSYLALSYVPSNADSLDYHLARVEHWIQNRSIAPFATNFTAQVDYSPLTEYNLAHFHLLVGSDRLDGFVQLFAALVCVIAASEIARLLGAGALVQAGAAVVCTTIPSLVLSATSTENNVFTAALCVCLVFVLLAQHPIRNWWSFGIFVGLAASLAVLDKGTAIALIGPVAVLLLIWNVLSERRLGVAARLGVGLAVVGAVAATAVVVAGPFLYQEQSVFGSLEGPDAAQTLSTDLTWRAAGANIVRETAANFMFGNGQNGPQTAVSNFTLRQLHDVYDAFGVRQDNTTYFLGYETPWFYDGFLSRNDSLWDRSADEGADPLDVVLIGFTLVVSVILLVRGDRRMRVVVLIAGGLTIGFLLLAAVARFQIFAVRFYIPLFVAWSPLIALALGRCSKWLLRVAMVVLAVACLPQLLDNVEQPLMKVSYGSHPLAAYLVDHPNPNFVRRTAGDLESLTSVLAQSTCRRIGIGSFLVFEYPVWVGLHNDGWRGQMEDVDVTNATKRYEDPRFRPCAVVTQPATASWVGTEPGMVHLAFGPTLALSIEPSALRTVRVDVPGFVSTAPEVHVYPGTGWTYGNRSTTLHDRGTVYVSSPQAQGLALRVVGPGGRPLADVIVHSAAGPTPLDRTGTTGLTDATGTASIAVERGLTPVIVTPPVAAGQSTPITGVTIGALDSSPGAP